MKKGWILTEIQWAALCEKRQDYYDLKVLISKGENIFLRDFSGEIFAHLQVDELDMIRLCAVS